MLSVIPDLVVVAVDPSGDRTEPETSTGGAQHNGPGEHCSGLSETARLESLSESTSSDILASKNAAETV